MEKLGISFPYFIAPMVGITHVAFRELVRHYTPARVQPPLFTEMVSSRRLPNQSLDTVECLRTSTGEAGLIPQLLANDEEMIAGSWAKLRWLSPWGIDINMGCPASQTLKHNWGVQLMHRPEAAAAVVAATKKYATVPVSVKLRAALGRQHDEAFLLSFTAKLEEAGADWLTVHCRTQGQGHHGYANWEVLQALAVERSIPIVANGDIQTWEDALAVRERYGVDGAMVARSAIARPWILWQIAHKLGAPNAPQGAQSTAPPFTPEEEGQEFLTALLRYSCLLDRYFGETPETLKKLFFHLTHASRWLFYGHEFLTRSKRCKSLFEFRDFIHIYREQASPRLVARAMA